MIQLMTIEQFEKYHRAQPFRPFQINLADGRNFAVRHPEFVMRTKAGRTIAVSEDDGDGIEMIDLLLVTSLGHLKNGSRTARK